MSTLTPDQHKDIALTVDVGEQLTLIIVFGPGYLADEGLAEVRQMLGVGVCAVIGSARSSCRFNPTQSRGS